MSKPWTWTGDFNFTNNGHRIILDNEGNAVAHVLAVSDRKRGADFDALDPERDARAALIVRAVNSHHALADALQRFIRDADNVADALNITGLDEAIGQARAALRAARGEP